MKVNLRLVLGHFRMYKSSYFSGLAILFCGLLFSTRVEPGVFRLYSGLFTVLLLLAKFQGKTAARRYLFAGLGFVVFFTTQILAPVDFQNIDDFSFFIPILYAYLLPDTISTNVVAIFTSYIFFTYIKSVDPGLIIGYSMGMVSLSLAYSMTFNALRRLSKERDELQQLNQKLFAANQKLQTIFDSSPVAIAGVDLQGKVISWNRAAEEISGLSEQKMLGNSLPESITGQVIYEEIKEQLLQGRTIKCWEAHLCRQNGSMLELNISAAPLHNQQGKINGFLTIFSDITERKRIEAEMTESRRKLERAERMASLGMMAAGITHEIGQPLNALKVTADGMLYWSKKGNFPTMDKIIRNFATISEQAERINEIIRNIRSFVKTEDLPKLTACDLNIAVKDVLNLLSNQLTAHGIALKIALDPGIPLLQGVRGRLEEIVVNLLVNAMDALDEVTKTNKEIYCRTSLDHDFVLLEIADNAAGIDRELAKKIFEPFFTTKKPGDGMGLGLSIVHSIVDSMNGVIEVTNNSKGGATFRVLFPVTQWESEKQ